MKERNVNKFEAEYGHRFCALTFHSDRSDGVYVEFSNESVEDGRPPVIRVYKYNDDNGSGLVRGYLVDESPDFKGLIKVTKEEDRECVIPVKTYDGEKTYLVLSSEVDKRNPSYAKFVIGERGTYNMDLAQEELKVLSELFSASYMTANSQDALALRELTHFVEKYIIPRAKTNYQLHLNQYVEEVSNNGGRIMVDEHYRMCAFTFHKKTGEDMLFDFSKRRGGNMRISLNVCSGGDSKYGHLTSFSVLSGSFHGYVDCHPRVSSYTVPVTQDNGGASKLRWDFFNETDHPNEVRLKVSVQESNDNSTVIIDEYIDTSKNNSIQALQRFLEMYVVPDASVNYQVHPEVE